MIRDDSPLKTQHKILNLKLCLQVVRQVLSKKDYTTFSTAIETVFKDTKEKKVISWPLYHAAGSAADGSNPGRSIRDWWNQ
jgi:hypothetical protein